MITIAAAALVLAAMEIPTVRIADDARAIDRVAAASKRDLPHDLLKRILNEDIELLRGKHADGTYEYAGYERFESGRASKTFSVQPRDETLEIRGSFVYRVVIQVPSRRLLVAPNRKLYVDRAEIEYLPLVGNTAKTQTVKLDAWIDPGGSREVDFEAIARQATVRVFAHADQKTGYGNLSLSLLQGRVFDNPDSPYADAVASAKAILRAIDHDDVPSIRAMASRMANDLQPAAPASSTVTVVSTPSAVPITTTAAPPPSAATGEIYSELLVIQDLLNGTEAERKQALERLHRLIQKVRPQAP